jgi:hypothetical protein
LRSSSPEKLEEQDFRDPSFLEAEAHVLGRLDPAPSKIELSCCGVELPQYVLRKLGSYGTR